MFYDYNKYIHSITNVQVNTTIKKRKYKKRRKKCLKRRKRKYIKKIKLKKINKTKGFIHDVNTIQFSIDNINDKYNYKITLIGDKGYITKKTYKYKNNEINLITVKRKNQRLDKTEYLKIKKRKIIENTIACLKKMKE